MSGHSKWATIHRQKETKDAKRGQVFTKLTNAITCAVRASGGITDPEKNFKLRLIVEKARAFNMPKENIERAIAKATTEAANLEEITYEGFGPGGFGVMVEVLSDNKNRTAQEIKNIFEKGGGSLAGPNAVAFNFESKGFLLVRKTNNPDAQMLQLIDIGAEDIIDSEDGFEVYVAPDKLSQVHKKLVENGFEVTQTELQMKPKNLQTIDSLGDASKAIKFLDDMESLEDVQKVFSNLDIPDETMRQIPV